MPLEKSMDLKGMENQQLLGVHLEIHGAWNRFKEGKGLEGWSKEDYYNVHKLIVEEMQRRQMNHNISNDLDEVSIGKGPEEPSKPPSEESPESQEEPEDVSPEGKHAEHPDPECVKRHVDQGMTKEEAEKRCMQLKKFDLSLGVEAMSFTELSHHFRMKSVSDWLRRFQNEAFPQIKGQNDERKKQILTDLLNKMVPQLPMGVTKESLIKHMGSYGGFDLVVELINSGKIQFPEGNQKPD